MPAIKKAFTDAQRVEFAKHIEYIFEASYSNWRRVLLMSLLKGVATGFGVILGGTIMVALLLWMLSGLGQIPLLGNVAEKAQDTIQQGTK
jgi:hypothetical protein